MKRLSLFVALVLSCAAFAQEEYRRTQVPGKTLCLAWGVRDYVYTYHSAGSARTPGTAEFVAMDQAFSTWATLAKQCTDFKFTKAAPVAEATVGYTQGATDNTNVLTFREVNCRDAVPTGDPCLADETCGNKYKCWNHSDKTIGLTTVTFSFRTGTIFDADIEFNASTHMDGDSFLFTTIGSPKCDPSRQSPLCVATDVQNTITHEVGHAVGLDHVDAELSTMAPSAPIGETTKRILDNGSARGFCDTYPVGLPPNPCDGTLQVSHKIVAVSRGTGTAPGVGCSTAESAPFIALPLLLLLRAARRRQSRSA